MRPKNNKPYRAKSSPTPRSTLPAAWPWWVDELIPTWVKKTYSPRETWKNKPFSDEDCHFFFRGIEELSELFTDERPAKLPSYFAHPKFRSAYLLYFLPLQAAKFISIFQLHEGGIQAAIEHGRKNGKITIADLGAGPGTASFAFLLHLLDEMTKGNQKNEIPPIELHWLDINKSILEDGKALVEQLADQFPKLRGKVQIHLNVAPWWEAPAHLPKETSLILLGNVLNEAQLPRQFTQSTSADESDSVSRGKSAQLWAELLRRAQGGGILFLEPALRKSSQLLSTLRNEFLALELLPQEASSIWGPCLHAGNCPLAGGRDWCHFSVPIQIPGKAFAFFSKGLGSERHWVKFSYLWLASESHPSPLPQPKLRRVISDPLDSSQHRRDAETVLICEPDRTGKIKVPASKRVRRGDVIEVRG